MPDNQEAFFSGLGEGASPAARQASNVAKNFDGSAAPKEVTFSFPPRSLIFEIVERIETDADVAGYFFEDYADACAVTNNVEMNFFARSVERACS